MQVLGMCQGVKYVVFNGYIEKMEPFIDADRRTYCTFKREKGYYDGKVKQLK